MERVLEVIYGLGYGGIRACIQNYVSHINHSEFQVDIYAYGVSDSPFKQQFESLGCNVFLEPTNDIANKNITGFICKLYRYIKNGNYDVVHAHCNLISAWVLLAAKMAGVKIRISHSHATNHFTSSFKQRCWSYFRRWIISRTATVKLACGDYAGKTMYGENDNYMILPNGIDVERFATVNIDKVNKLKNEFGVQADVKVYMNMTRFDYNKNHLFILDIAKYIHQQEPSSIFILGGNYTEIDNSYDAVKATVSEYKLDDCVILSGPRMDIVDMYHLSDCWIFPSIKEGLPFGPIELQAASIPCIASDSITREIDLGLGLIEFVSLDKSPHEWAIKAMAMHKKKIPYDTTLRAFKKHEFDIRANVNKLEKIYKGDI